MGLFDRVKSAVRERSAAGKEENEEAVREKILNDPKFMEALEHNPNVDVDSDFETLRKAYEAFKLKDKASSELQKLFRDQLQHDLGISLDEAGREQVKNEIEAYMQAEMMDNPDHIAELAQQIEEFAQTQNKIKEQEKVLTSLGGDVNFFKKKKAAIMEIHGSKRLFERLLGPSAKRRAAERSAQHNFGVNLASLDKEYLTVEEKLGRGESAEAELKKLRSGFTELRKAVLQDLAPMAALSELARTKAREKLNSLNSPATENLSSLDKAREFFKKVKGTEFDKNTGLDYMGDLDEAEFMTALDARMELAIKQDLEQAVDRVAGNNKTLKAMMSGLKPFLTRQELGSKDSGATREFVFNHLKNEVLPTLSKSKQMLLTAALAYYE